MGAVGFAETTRFKNELIGPVRSVTIKKHGYSTTETYDRAGHLMEAVLDLTHANTATYSLFRYDQDGHLQEELAFDQRGRIRYRKQVAYARDPEGRDTASVTASDDGHFQNAEFSLYDQRSHLWEQLWVSSTTSYKSLYDIQGHRIYSAYYRKGELLNELKHGYDVLGRLQELVSYDAHGTLTGLMTNDYDATGKRTRTTTHTFGVPRAPVLGSRPTNTIPWATGSKNGRRNNPPHPNLPQIPQFLLWRNVRSSTTTAPTATLSCAHDPKPVDRLSR